MRKIGLYRYQLPMNSGQVLRDQRPVYRAGLIVRLQVGARQGWGEIAPLPGFSQETLAQAQAVASQWLALWCAGECAPLPALPSVAFGLSVALAELSGGLPATLSAHTVPLLSLATEASRDLSGVTLAKCKVARALPEQEAERMQALLARYPRLKLRLDANRGWSAQQARRFAAVLGADEIARVAFIEEPCQTMAQSCQFSRDTGLPIAWDESTRTCAFARLCLPEVVALVVKPTLWGSIARVRQCVDAAHAAGLTVVLSSSIESSLGLSQIARLAAWLTPQAIPGLDTLALLSAQLIRRWPGSDLPLYGARQLDCVQRASASLFR